MKITFLTFLILFLGIFTLQAQQKEIEIQLKNIFHCVQNNDEQCYQSFWIDENSFIKLYKKSNGKSTYDSPIYFKSIYQKYRAEMLGAFAVAITNMNYEAGGNLQDFILEKIHIIESNQWFFPPENSKSAMLLLKKKNDNKQWVMNVANILFINNKIYAGTFQDIQMLQGISFDEMIKTMENFKKEVAENTGPAVKGDNETSGDEPEKNVIHNVDFTGFLQNREIQFHFEITNSFETPNYENSYYIFLDQDGGIFFRQVIDLGSDNWLFIQNDGNYFHLKRIADKMIGNWVSITDNKQQTIVLTKYED